MDEKIPEKDTAVVPPNTNPSEPATGSNTKSTFRSIYSVWNHLLFELQGARGASQTNRKESTETVSESTEQEGIQQPPNFNDDNFV